MKVKTEELTGPTLDWAVAKIEGLPIRKDPMGFGKESPGGYWVWPDNWPPEPAYMQIGKKYSPSTNWTQGGPIIERERMSIFDEEGVRYLATKNDVIMRGPTPLITAMRCYVASKLGDEVDVPEELV